jgi:hypothetical protein
MKKNHPYRVKLSPKQKRDIELCAKANGISTNRFIKDAITQHLLIHKSELSTNDHVLRNQLRLFDPDNFNQDVQLELDL